jgi:uncharacterized protein YjbI with pentapeptide repeats
MKLYKIKQKQSGSILFQGDYQSFKHCIEDAVNQNISLKNADFSHQNLSNAMLDDADFEGADFSHANLTGANLTHTNLSSCDFSHATLYNCFLSLSSMHKCNFSYAFFGGTDIAGALIDYASFAGSSTFSLAFINTESMMGCTYYHDETMRIEFNQPPLVVGGLGSEPIEYVFT